MNESLLNNESNGFNDNSITALPANENNSTIHQSPVKPASSKIPLRPSGIPKLSTSTTNTGSYQNRSITSPNVSTGRPISANSQHSSNNSHISPSYSKRSRNFSTQKSNEPTRPRSTIAQSLNRYDRAMSEENQLRQLSRDSSNSELTNNSSTGNSCGVITSKIGSLQNARHKPGGGNVQIVSRKIDFSHVDSKCGSTKNMKHRPGGGNIQIFEEKVDFSKVQTGKVGSMKNVKHKPTGGDVKIESRKLEWNVDSKIGSLNNVKHKPTGGQVKIVNQQLPWLKFNKPNLPPEEIAKINKKAPKPDGNIMSPSRSSYSNSICSDKSS